MERGRYSIMGYRISSFITSMLPFCLYLIIKYFEYSPIAAYIFIIILVLAILNIFYKFFYVINKNETSLIEMDIENPTYDGNLLTNYLLVNVLPIMCLDFTSINSNGKLTPNIPVIVGGGFVFVSLFLLYLDYRMDYCNPLLQLMGYHFFNADLEHSNGSIEHNCIIISRKRFNFYTNNTASYYPLYNGVYVYVKEECNG